MQGWTFPVLLVVAAASHGLTGRSAPNLFPGRQVRLESLLRQKPVQTWKSASAAVDEREEGNCFPGHQERPGSRKCCSAGVGAAGVLVQAQVATVLAEMVQVESFAPDRQWRPSTSLVSSARWWSSLLLTWWTLLMKQKDGSLVEEAQVLQLVRLHECLVAAFLFPLSAP